MDKKDDKKICDKEFLTIKEFSEFVGISVHMLRHYDKKGVFLPSKRGVDFNNKYRYYSPTQITSVKMVRVLADIRVPLKTIRELAQDRTPEKLLKLLKKYTDIMDDEIHLLQDAYSVIKTYVNMLYEGVSATESDIIVSEMPEKKILLGGLNDYNDTVGFVREFTRFCSASHEPKLNKSYPIGGFWESMSAYLDEPSQPARFFSLDPAGYEQKESGQYLIGYTRGYYGQVNDLPKRMVDYANKNGIEFTGPVYNTYLFDEISIGDPEQYLLQVAASVKETRRVPSLRMRSLY